MFPSTFSAQNTTRDDRANGSLPGRVGFLRRRVTRLTSSISGGAEMAPKLDYTGDLRETMDIIENKSSLIVKMLLAVSSKILYKH